VTPKDGPDPDALLGTAAAWLARSKLAIALTGAGMSTESGIPDFRSKGGLWTKFDPGEYANIEAFVDDPEKVWRMVKEMLDTVLPAKPNLGHIALADLEKEGVIRAVVTQNVDGLHQEAGSKEVIEFHGNCRELSCPGTSCHLRYSSSIYLEECPPRCKECDSVLRPEFVFFGEPIPRAAIERSISLAEACDVILVAGTSAMVTPAALLPQMALQRGARIIEVNLEYTVLSPHADITLIGKAGDILPALLERVDALRAKG
jgi:NAD-dependent deacetylase